MTNSSYAATPVLLSRVLSLFLESIAYGIYVISFSKVVRVLFFDKRCEGRVSIPLVIATGLLAVVITVDIIANLALHLQAFVFYQGPGGAVAVFINPSYWPTVIEDTCACLLTLIAEAALIYRCLVVYYYDWRIIVLPILFWFGNLSSSLLLVTSSATSHSTSLLLTASQFRPYVTSFLSICTSTVILTTGLISYRIWRITKDTAELSIQSSGPKLNNVNRIIIESGLLAALSSITSLISYLTSDNGIYAVGSLAKVVYGIAFNLITVRARQGIAIGESTLYVSSVRFNQGRSLLAPSTAHPTSIHHVDDVAKEKSGSGETLA